MLSIFHEVEIKSSPEMVYLAITDENLIACWWLTGARIAAEERAIGIFPLDKGKEKIVVEVLQLVPNQLVRWKCLEHKFREWHGTEISFELAKNSNGSTTLRFRHSGWKDDSGAFGATSFYWAAQYLNNLKILLEKK